MTSPGLRRRPVQRRSIERYERILDACAQLLDDVGIDRLTAHQVAGRAGVPIGTVYQFFDGTDGMLGELGRRNLDRLVDGTLRRADGSVRSWDDAADLVLDEYAAMMRSVPGFTVLDLGDSHGFVAPVMIAARLHAVAVDSFGLPPLADGERVIMLMMAVTGAAMRLAFQLHPDGDPGTLADTKRLVRGHLVAEAVSPSS